MKRLLVIVALFLISVTIVSCAMQAQEIIIPTSTPIPPTATGKWPSSHTPQPSSGSSGGRVSCTVNEYKAEAKQHMQRIADLTDQSVLKATPALKRLVVSLRLILSDIRGMKCAEAYPLKQETLEYTAIHATRAIGQFSRWRSSSIRMNQLDSAILNAQWFNDWSLDMEKK